MKNLEFLWVVLVWFLKCFIKRNLKVDNLINEIINYGWIIKRENIYWFK